MLKKSIIGLLLLAIAMPAFAGGDVEKKIESGSWPVVFKYVAVCEHFKVLMNVGYYVKIQKCKELKLKLKQTSIKEYEGCLDFNIMSNFDLVLSSKIFPTAAGLNIAPAGKWSSWISSTQYLAPSTSYKKRTVCAKVKDAVIIKADPKKELLVGKITIYVRPTATP